MAINQEQIAADNTAEAMNQDEAQQAARLGMTKEPRIAELAEIRKSCDDGLAFKNAVQEAGYVLAKGDQSGSVLVDAEGEIYSLTKFLPDLKGKDFRAFMTPVDRDTLPTVGQGEGRAGGTFVRSKIRATGSAIPTASTMFTRATGFSAPHSKRFNNFRPAYEYSASPQVLRSKPV